MSILIADSGGTKTDWALAEQSKSAIIKGTGLHPSYMTVDQIEGYIREDIKIVPERVYFYGAGCHGDKPKSKITEALKKVFPLAKIEVMDDLTGAARAHLQNSEGIVALFGTGSICGRCKRGKIIERSASLGYAIGDEGSAADLGRSIIKAYFRRALNLETKELVEHLLVEKSYSDIMSRIYSSERPNRELAMVAGNILSNPLTVQLKELVLERFTEFIDTQLAMLVPSSDERIVCTGQVAIAHADILLEAMATRGLKKVSITRNIIEGLVRYHTV